MKWSCGVFKQHETNWPRTNSGRFDLGGSDKFGVKICFVRFSNQNNLKGTKGVRMKTIVSLVVVLVIASAASLQAADAKALWDANCAQCHGKSGNADTKMGKTLNAKDLTDSKVQEAFSDAKAAESIKNGVKENGKTTMKAFGGKLSEDDIKALVAYVRTLKK